jgi:hypothetical protein
MSSVECLNFNYEDKILSATAVCTHFHALLRPKSMNENYKQPTWSSRRFQNNLSTFNYSHFLKFRLLFLIIHVDIH